MTRYYYTCPIKAAYMNHNFGVITYIELSIKSEIFDKYFIKDWNNRELRLDKKEKYYVAKESEHIFDKKNGDPVLTPTGCLAFYDKDLVQNNSRIIMRDGKELFMPEVENDT